MRSTTQIDFPAATRAIEAKDQPQIEKLDGIARNARAAAERLRRAVSNEDAEAVGDALYHLSSIGSTVNSWSRR